MSKVLIVDDESLARSIVKKYLQEHPNLEIVGECSNGFDAVKAINEMKPDILFLDVQMPKLTGFELLELIDFYPQIIFTTAYDNYAIKAFEVNAVDYLLKPFSQERFNTAIKKLTFSNQNENEEKVKELRATTDKGDFLTRIFIKDKSNIVIIPVEQIKFIESQDDYVKIVSELGNHFKKETTGYYEERLNPKDFLRIHRSYIVNLKVLKQIEIYDKESYRVHLIDKTILPVSKQGYKRLKEIFS